MAKNKINFITGETYTLSELFSGDRRIIIPDLQRDYCWGDENNVKSSGETGELVSDFVNNLIEQYEKKETGTLNLGLFYGYEVPADHIQLCDGQQRLTTLYLLLGMLNKRTGKFRQNLISDFEYKHDDKEPYLNYAIRETSLYFLSDLVCQFFISNKDEVNKIKKYPWYFKDYDLDPSIGSMINAMQKIEIILNGKSDEWTEDFGNWMLKKLTFLYFDMEDRKNGEETFVIINTTGEPLSVTQNLKPLIISNPINKDKICDDGKEKGVDELWEEIETFFWQNRNEENGNDTSDAGFAEFLRWISIIEQRDEVLPKDKQDDNDKYLIQKILRGEGKCEFPYKDISFEDIWQYYESLQWIIDNNDIFGFEFSKFLSPGANKEYNNKKFINQVDCFRLLPILLYVKNNRNNRDEELKRRTLRVFHFFKNIARLLDINKDMSDALKITYTIKNNDITYLLDQGDTIPTRILTKEERCKLEIFRDYESYGRRNEVEDLFWEVQAKDLWKGQIMPLIEWSESDKVFDFDKFRKYVEVLNELFKGEVEHEERICLLRRCLIICQPQYKPFLRGSYLSFGWEWNEWNNLLTRDDSTKKLLDYLITESTELSIEQSLEKYIETNITSVSPNNRFLEFAADSFLMDFTRLSKACDMKKDMNEWQISCSGGTGRHSRFISKSHAYILKGFGANYTNYDNAKDLDNEGLPGWSVWYWAEKPGWNCVVFQNNIGIKIDVRFYSGDTKGGRLECILKETSKNSISLKNFSKILSVFGLASDENAKVILDKNMETFDAVVIRDEIMSLMSEVDEGIKKI